MGLMWLGDQSRVRDRLPMRRFLEDEELLRGEVVTLRTAVDVPESCREIHHMWSAHVHWLPRSV